MLCHAYIIYIKMTLFSWKYDSDIVWHNIDGYKFIVHIVKSTLQNRKYLQSSASLIAKTDPFQAAVTLFVFSKLGKKLKTSI